MHQVRGLYDKILNAIGNGALQSLIHVVDLLAVSCLNVVNNDLSRESSSYGPVGVRCCNRILNTLDVSNTAVIEGSTKAYYQDLVVTDLILISRIILGSVAGISAEVIRICVLTFYQFLLRIGKCIPRCLCLLTLHIGILRSALNIDSIDQLCDMVSCCLIGCRLILGLCLGGCFAGCCRFRGYCLGSCCRRARCCGASIAASASCCNGCHCKRCDKKCCCFLFHVSSFSIFMLTFNFF